HGHLHHLDRATGEPEGHPHQRAGARPGDEVVGARQQKTFIGELAREPGDKRILCAHELAAARAKAVARSGHARSAELLVHRLETLPIASRAGRCGAISISAGASMGNPWAGCGFRDESKNQVSLQAADCASRRSAQAAALAPCPARHTWYMSQGLVRRIFLPEEVCQPRAQSWPLPSLTATSCWSSTSRTTSVRAASFPSPMA